MLTSESESGFLVLLGLLGRSGSTLLPFVMSATLWRDVSMMSELVATGRVDTRGSLDVDVTVAF